MSESPNKILAPAANNLPADPPNASTLEVVASDLDSVLEQAHDQLELQMLLIEVASCGNQADFSLIARAYHFAKERHEGQQRKSGRPFLQHCVEVARLLAQLRMDDTTVAAGLLHDVIEDTPATYDEIVGLFGEKIANLIDGVTKIDRFTYESREARQAETYRKMLLSMVKDIRVIIIKLADRLHNMRTLDFIGADAQKRIARETLDVYTPLAHRFGLARIRWELEDRSLKFLKPEIYAELREKVSMKRREREDYIEEFKAPIEEELKKSSIEAEIGGRAKNFYSIYNKMQARGKPFEEIYDLLAVRIIVKNMRECYHTLGLVHGIYRPVPERIKDYISMPKSNMYQSLHTSVIGPRGLPVEVQIRTGEMHHTAELGIAAHWRYKSGETTSSNLDQHMSWLRQVIDMQQETTDPEEFLKNLKTELFQDEIFVFTPKGDLQQFPQGATPIDFAFNIHTDIGLHCLTAKVNDHIVPLRSELNSGDTVQIITSPHQSPSRSWLESVKTNKAQQAIRRWFKDEEHAHSVRLGQEILTRELLRYPNVSQQENMGDLASELGLESGEQLYAALGSGDISIGRIISHLLPHPQPKQPKPHHQDRRGICIQGMNNLMISFGKCCTPIPGDAVIGLTTRGRGITVHRTDCPNMGHISKDPDRLLQVSWDLEKEQAFTVKLRVRSHDRKYLLSDISRALGDSGCNIQSATTRTADGAAEQDFRIDVANIAQLQQAMKNANRIKGVLKVQRLDESGSDLTLAT